MRELLRRRGVRVYRARTYENDAPQPPGGLERAQLSVVCEDHGIDVHALAL
jgi:hypothetical protein